MPRVFIRRIKWGYITSNKNWLQSGSFKEQWFKLPLNKNWRTIIWKLERRARKRNRAESERNGKDDFMQVDDFFLYLNKYRGSWKRKQKVVYSLYCLPFHQFVHPTMKCFQFFKTFILTVAKYMRFKILFNCLIRMGVLLMISCSDGKH